jgi:uncharacterized protein Veg
MVEMANFNLEEIFKLITERITMRISSLSAIERFRNIGIGLEGWFKVEVVKALEREFEVEEIKGKGPDLKFRNGKRIELKAASDFNPSYIISGLTYENCPCVFLARVIKRNKKMKEEEIETELNKKGREGIYLKDDYGRKKSDNKKNITLKLVNKVCLKNNWFLGIVEKTN